MQVWSSISLRGDTDRFILAHCKHIRRRLIYVGKQGKHKHFINKIRIVQALTAIDIVITPIPKQSLVSGPSTPGFRSSNLPGVFW